jgi:hypothetical protein
VSGQEAAGASVSTLRQLPTKAYLERHQRLDVTYKVEELAKAFPFDPDRCGAFGMAVWNRVPNAFAYEITAYPTQAVGVGAVKEVVTDDAPHYLFSPDGYALSDQDGVLMVQRHSAPPTVHATSLGSITWPSTQARLPLNALSSGEGCAHAKANLVPWRTVGIARVSVPVITFKSRPKKIRKAPSKAIMMVVEVEGALYRLRTNGTRERLRNRDFIRPGDVLVTAPGTYAAIEAVTGGRIGIAADRAILVLDQGDVKDITDDGVLRKARIKSLRIWRKFSTRKEPLEIETAGGVFGIKG